MRVLTSENAKDTIGLDDCGKWIVVHNSDYGYEYRVEVQMIIKAPRGTLVIYNDPSNLYRRAGKTIRAFVKGHKND